MQETVLNSHINNYNKNYLPLTFFIFLGILTFILQNLVSFSKKVISL